MRTTVEHITPDVAAKYLLKNTRNRPFKQQSLDYFAERLRAGSWRLTHHGIAFGTDGVLLDGQHRLMAVVETGIAASVQVSYDVDPQTFVDLDRAGSTRTGANLLSIAAARQGVEMPNAVKSAAIARAALCGLKNPRIHNEQINAFALSVSVELSEVLQALPSSTCQAPVHACLLNGIRFMDGSRALLAHAKRMASGVYLYEGDPLLSLDRTLNGKKGGRVQSWKRALTRTDIYAIALSAFRAAMDGRKLARLEGSDKDWGETPGDARIKKAALQQADVSGSP